MRKEDVERYVRERLLRPRLPDRNVIRTLLLSAEQKIATAKKLLLDKETATLIYLGVYESIRQLGNVQWRLSGYEALSHDVSMKLLEESDVREKLPLRNKVNYRGQTVSVLESREILFFWDTCAVAIRQQPKKNVS